MGDFKVEYAEEKSLRLFSNQLACLAKELALPLPYVKGKRMEGSVPEEWEIKGYIIGDPSDDEIPQWCHTGTYPSWDMGVDMMMHDLLSRMCFLYKDKIPPTSPFKHFAMRNQEGEVMITGGDRTNMYWARRHIEDLEIYAVQSKDLVRMKVAELKHAYALLHQQGQEIGTLNTLVDVMATRIQDLEAQVAAQNPPPHSSDEDSDGDDDDDDDDNEDGGDEGGAQAGEGGDNAQADDEEDNAQEGEDDAPEAEEEEEDPEEVEFEEQDAEDSGEEYEPPAPKRRKCVRSTTYLKRFKKIA